MRENRSVFKSRDLSAIRTYFGFKAFGCTTAVRHDLAQGVVFATLCSNGEVEHWVLDDIESKEDLFQYYEDNEIQIDWVIFSAPFDVARKPRRSG